MAYRLTGYASRGGEQVFDRGNWVTVMASYPYATIEVFLSGTATLATLFDDESGLVPKPNPFQADGTARWTFCAATGLYDVRFSGAGIPTTVISGLSVGVGAGSVLSFNTRSGDVYPEYGDYTSDLIVHTPAGGISSINVQAAINELDTEKATTSALSSGLAGKANTSHTHVEGDVTGLVSDLAGKAPTVHSHSAFVASGPSHAAGFVPDPGVTPGSTKYLCENGSFSVPAGGGGGGGGSSTSWPSTTVLAHPYSVVEADGYVLYVSNVAAAGGSIILPQQVGITGRVFMFCNAQTPGNGNYCYVRVYNWDSGGTDRIVSGGGGLPAITTAQLTPGGIYRFIAGDDGKWYYL